MQKILDYSSSFHKQKEVLTFCFPYGGEFCRLWEDFGKTRLEAYVKRTMVIMTIYVFNICLWSCQTRLCPLCRKIQIKKKSQIALISHMTRIRERGKKKQLIILLRLNYIYINEPFL